MPEQRDAKPISPKSKDSKSLAAIIGLFGTVIAIAVSVTQVVASFVEMDIQNKKDEIEWSFKTADFLVKNKDLVLSEDEKDFEFFMMMVKASFPNMRAIEMFISLAQKSRDDGRRADLVQESIKMEENLEPAQREMLKQQLQVPVEKGRLVLDKNILSTIRAPQVVLRASVAFDPLDGVLADRIVNVLKERGFQVTTREKRRLRDDFNIQIKYFHNEDRELAGEVQAAIQGVLRSGPRVPVRAVFEQDRSGRRARGTFEVLIG